MKRDTQAGSILLSVMALLAAIGVVGAISARLLLSQRHAARAAYEQAVARTLADGGIEVVRAAIRRGAPLPSRAFTNAVVGGRFIVAVTMTSRPRSGRTVEISSSATVRAKKDRRKLAAHRITARMDKRGGRIVVTSWSEAPILGP